MSKDKALDLFHNPPQSPAELFNKAFAIYSEAPNCNKAILRSLNTGGNTKYNLETLMYEIQKAYGIKDLEKVKPKVVVTTEITEGYIFNPDSPEIITISEDSTFKGIEDTLVIIDADIEADTTTQKETTEAATEQQPKFTDEYPFINDTDCPDEIKILVHDKMAAYRRYAAAHEQLAKHTSGEAKLSEDEYVKIAKSAADDFAESEACKKELDYYKENKRLLAEHPTLKKIAMQREVDAMTVDEAHKFINSSASFFSRNKTKLASAQSDVLKADLEAKLAERETKVALVKEKLGLSGK